MPEGPSLPTEGLGPRRWVDPTTPRPGRLDRGDHTWTSNSGRAATPMLHRHRRAFASSIYAFDIGALVGGTLLGTWVARTPLPDVTQWVAAAAAGAIAWTFVGQRLHLYQSRRTTSVLPELGAIAIASVLGQGVILLTLAALTPGFTLHVGAGLAATILAMGSLRLVARSTLSALRGRGLNTRTALFIGRGPTARTIAEDYQSHPNYGIRILGDLTFTGEQAVEPTEGVPHLGAVANLQPVLKEHAIDEVLICPSHDVWTTEVRSVLRFLESTGLNCRVAPDFLGLPLERTTISMTGDVPTYEVFAGFADPRLLALKRLIDVVGSGLGLLALAPMLTVVAAVVKFTSKGPVLFRQCRLGLHCHPFTMLKFRSMRPDAEELKAALATENEQDGPVFKIQNDPRITPIGRFLRKYSLDELPQLINVLRGDMSIVGPRPPVPSEVVEYDWWQRRRLSVRPGLTCIWQVSGRNTISFDRWMELDLQYIDGWSLGMDLKIMIKTVKEVLRGGGA